MYRTYEDILDALVSGKTSKKNASRYIYNYKKSGRYDLAAMWFKAKIIYEGEYENNQR